MNFNLDDELSCFLLMNFHLNDESLSNNASSTHILTLIEMPDLPS